MTGNGVFTAVPIGGGFYDVSSSFSDLTASITLPSANSPSPSPLVLTGLNFSQSAVVESASGGSAPFYFLYPPNPSDPGLYYDTVTGTAADSQNLDFHYGSSPAESLHANFAGADSLTFGSSDNETTSGNVVKDDYGSDSSLDLTTTIGEGDPITVFAGDLYITTPVAGASAPDSSTGLAGILALLGICAGGAWHKKARAA
jgi:hypothetical protein